MNEKKEERKGIGIKLGRIENRLNKGEIGKQKQEKGEGMGREIKGVST